MPKTVKVRTFASDEESEAVIERLIKKIGSGVGFSLICRMALKALDKKTKAA